MKVLPKSEEPRPPRGSCQQQTASCSRLLAAIRAAVMRPHYQYQTTLVPVR